ncbi:type IX secretion system plug protein domain-containing protein [Sphingobacterium sp. SGG-5]|uniref:type IX secretion system plug protein n=1 Tax=Sphingobacterium sp. SGG-5 TaxID=2710881 RepID=UPI001F0F8BF7|nr:type IX secretion system plug protein domain-containing protein [Sphingobacterium sp. SGG-5]
MTFSLVHRHLFIFSLLFLFMGSVQAQKKKRARQHIEQSPEQTLVYDNKDYLPQIRSVTFYPTGKENQLPIYVLGTPDQLLLSFDDLRGDVRTYFFSIEHCDADWTPSRLHALDYAIGYNEDRIDNYRSSQGTLQPYTHYTCSFPNEYIAPKVAGNYLLKVYEDADKKRLIITRKFYVVRPLIQVESLISPSLRADKRLTNQKLNVSIRTSALTINNPYQDVQLHVFQNQRSDNKMILKQPMFIGNGEIKYNGSETLDFLGNNEFRYADLRSTKSASAQVKELTVDTAVHTTLFTDEDHGSLTYADTYDENGKFFIRNLDYGDAEMQSDYAHVRFSLQTNQQIQGKIFVVGGFNHFERTAENQLIYQKSSGVWETTLLLKQGLYDYEYVLETPDGQVITDAFSNSFYITGNDYVVLVYHRRTGTYWDEILGVGHVSIHNKSNKNL